MTDEQRIADLETEVEFLKQKLAENIEHTLRLNHSVSKINDAVNEIAGLTKEGFEALGLGLQKR